MLSLIRKASWLFLFTVLTFENVPIYTDGSFTSSNTFIEDMQCTAAAIRKANTQHLHGILQQLVNTTYFRLFRVQLEGHCPLDEDEEEDDWECPSSQASSAFTSSALGGGPKDEGDCKLDGMHTIFPVDKTLSKREDTIIENAEECDDENLPSFWLNLCSKLPYGTEEEYINLALNPEIFTGYNGSDIWKEIYNLNRFEIKEKGERICYEEQFLHRILSGLHSSIDIHISANYFPPRKGKRDHWEANINRFVGRFGKNEERFKNLQFAFVVLLRAARRASAVLRQFKYITGSMKEDYQTQTLMKLFLDSHVLDSCQEVFEAFDESLLFEDQDKHPLSTMSVLKRQFKGIFHNISETFNCVKCEKCRLHGKMQLLGIGTAIKILLVPEDLIRKSLVREEVVALINTLAKFSESLELYNDLLEKSNADKPVEFPPTEPIAASNKILQDVALKAIVESGAVLTDTEEDSLVDAVLDENFETLLLSKHFAMSKQYPRFLRHAKRRLSGLAATTKDQFVDVAVIGGGLAGLSSTISVLDRGGSVALIEKEAVFGGNSGKASSGINGIDETSRTKHNDSVEKFRQDVIKGSGRPEFANNPLVKVLTEGSVDALAWLRSRVGLPLREIGQLGGHSKPRTWRPSSGLAGSEIIAGLNKKLKETVAELPAARFKAFKKTRVVKIVTTEDGKDLVGVECVDASGSVFVVKARAIVLATGGYGFHYSKAGEKPLIDQYRPDLMSFATTNGKFATGDGIKLATEVGADTIDLDHVQVHPTAFIDMKDKKNPSKTLAAELLRGVGGVILDPSGRRFVNELGTRDYVSTTMLANQPNVQEPQFLLLLGSNAAAKAPKHVPMYMKRDLMFKFDTLEEVAKFCNNADVETLRASLEAYDKSVSDPTGSADKFNRTVFREPILPSSPYYAGWITPAVHYSMGGLRVNGESKVVDAANNVILGGKIYAAGETVGGIHGNNRLGGNGLTEAAVFGRHVGVSVPVVPAVDKQKASAASGSAESKAARIVSKQELQAHASANDCWVAIQGQVYDFTEFAQDHPGGAESVTKLAGTDGTKEFTDIHGLDILDDFDPIGTYVE